MLLLDHAMRPHLRSVICTRCTLPRPLSHTKHTGRVCLEIAAVWAEKSSAMIKKTVHFLVQSGSSVRNPTVFFFPSFVVVSSFFLAGRLGSRQWNKTFSSRTRTCSGFRTLESLPTRKLTMLLSSLAISLPTQRRRFLNALFLYAIV